MCLIRSALLLACGLTPLASAQCVGSWVSGFGAPGANAPVTTLAVSNLGTGPLLFAGGDFSAMGGVVANHIAVWNGSTWSPLGTGLDGTPVAMAGFDDGTGAALYVSGNFIIAGGISTFGFAKWNGSTWSLAPFVPPGGIPKALAVFNDGSGPHLYVGGNYAPSGVMKLIGGSWVAVPGYPGILSADVRALSVIDVGAGPRLYSVGQFVTSFGTQGFFGRWDGSFWEGQPVNGPPTTITTLATPSGVSVYVGGQSAPGSSFVACVIGTSTGPLSGLSGNVLALSDFDDGSGPALYAAGSFSFFPVTCGLARWNGGSWSPVDAYPCGTTHSALAKFDFGSGPELVAGGDFRAAGGVNASNIARWSGSAWNPLVSGQTNGIDIEIDALKNAALVSGPVLYAGGVFCTGNVARLDANGWQPLGAGLPTGGGNPTVVSSLQTFDDGTGPALYAGGYPLASPSVNMALGRWDGIAWSTPGGGVAAVSPAYNNAPAVFSLQVFDDGSGPALFVGGSFDLAGGVPVSGIASWNGTSWSALAGGVGGSAAASPPGIRIMEVHDDGTGPALYVYGNFVSAGGQSAQRLAKWTGTTWMGIPSSFGIGVPPSLSSMASFDDGSGPTLYVSGIFSTIGSVQAPGYAKWNGQTWTPGILPPGATSVNHLTVLDDGTGPALYAAVVVGSGAAAVTSLQRWNGASWTQLGLPFQSLPTVSISVNALAHHDDGSGQAIFAGGRFLSAGGIPSVGLAKWGTPRPTLSLTQVAGPGSGILISDLHLLPGRQYFNLFSTVPCAGAPGFGPYLGLCAPDPTPLIVQFQLPLGTVPFHFAAGGTTASFGPFSVPPGLVIDSVCFDYTGAALGCRSPVFGILVQ